MAPPAFENPTWPLGLLVGHPPPISVSGPNSEGPSDLWFRLPGRRPYTVRSLSSSRTAADTIASSELLLGFQRGGNFPDSFCRSPQLKYYACESCILLSSTSCLPLPSSVPLALLSVVVLPLPTCLQTFFKRGGEKKTKKQSFYGVGTRIPSTMFGGT